MGKTRFCFDFTSHLHHIEHGAVVHFERVEEEVEDAGLHKQLTQPERQQLHHDHAERVLLTIQHPLVQPEDRSAGVLNVLEGK